ncbi:hypothetical protein [Streptomyces sp. NPDC057438]|uniref:hypothetical protein n=1 Tax=Streptomyces sp. NPDC057438 TaxID=3346133 RepID=UPI00369D2DBE
MGRRTVRWRTAAAVGAALCAAITAAGPAAADDDPSPYAYAEGARTVEGATSSTGALRLSAGGTYHSSIGPGGKLYYRLDLGAAANAYVSATAVPDAGAAVASADGIRVSLQDADAHRCSYETARFGPTRSAHPVTAWASREIGSDEYMCQEAGTYYVVVERVGVGVGAGPGTGTGAGPGSASGSVSGSPADGSSAKWGLELGFVAEPAVTKSGSTSAPESFDSTPPEDLSGDPERRRGGSGFATASPVAQGVWQDEAGIRAGETLFYKVPVGWGQQLHVTADLGSTTGGDGYVGNAFTMSLYNPVRGFVDDRTADYRGEQRSTALDPLPPVAYENRFSPNGEVSGMRFAGWYYLALHLGASVADRYGEEPVGLTLRVRLEGRAGAGPGYLGTSEPRGVFEVTAEDQEAAEKGTAGETLEGAGTGDGGDDTETSADGEDSGDSSGGQRRLAMTVVAAGGIGTGSLLVFGLVVWTLVARRRASADAKTKTKAPSMVETEAGRTDSGGTPRGRHGASRGR